VQQQKELWEINTLKSWFAPMLVAVMENKLSRLSFAKVAGDARDLTQEDGKNTGSSLAMSLAVNLTAAGAKAMGR